MTLDGQQWIDGMVEQALVANHIWPRMAVCEAALESNYGKSQLAREGNNLFGMKLHSHANFGVLSLPTKEFLDGEWVTINAQWMKYVTIADCFADRMRTLIRLAPMYPHYQAALMATDAHEYVNEVSKTWSTDPNRAQKVIQITHSP